MAKKRDERLNELIVDTIRSAIKSDPTLIQSILQYTDNNTFTNPRSIPDLQTVQGLLQSGALIGQQFTQANLVDPLGNGNWQLPFSFPSGNIPLGIRIDYNYTSSGGGIGVKNLTVNAENDILYGFENPSFGTQTIRIFSSAINIVAPPTPTPPVFTLQPPASATILEGTTLTISVAANGATGFQWKRNGVSIAGQNTLTLTVTNFNSGNNGVYTCDAFNTDGLITSTGCAVTNDAGIFIFNYSNFKNDSLFTPNGAGRSVSFNDGTNSGTIAVGSFGRFLTNTNTLILQQSGSNALTLFDGTNFISNPINGLSVNNNFSKPIGGWINLQIYNNN